jgi:hypothetical protein
METVAVMVSLSVLFAVFSHPSASVISVPLPMVADSPVPETVVMLIVTGRVLPPSKTCCGFCEPTCRTAILAVLVVVTPHGTAPKLMASPDWVMGVRTSPSTVIWSARAEAPPATANTTAADVAASPRNHDLDDNDIENPLELLVCGSADGRTATAALSRERRNCR